MREVWVSDSETNPFDGVSIIKPFLWGCYNGDEYHEFTTTVEVVEFFRDKEVIVYAHNGGKFDYFFMLEHFDEFTPVMVIAGRLAKFKIGAAEFRDSYNILPFGLGQYQKDKIDYSIFSEEERHKPENWRAIQKYLKSDCVYLYELVTDFIDRYGMHLTQAGAAMKIWSKMSGIKTPNTSRDFYESFAPYYYGGRVQCFESGEIFKDFKVIDINSAYPDAMYHYHAWGTNYNISASLPDSREKTQRAFITLSGVAAGCFPFRDESGALTFPNDGEKRVYQVTGWEFLSALKTGALTDWDIIKVLSFIEKIEFRSYVDRFFKLKRESKESGDDKGYLFAKIFLNALYGKFGANSSTYKKYELMLEKYIRAAEIDGFDYSGKLGDWALMQKDLEEEEQRYYNVAVAASITGFVRAKMWDAISQCDGVMYCDTDSIVCESTGTLELDPQELGAWDIEAECDYAAIAGKKMYAFRKKDGKYKTASKGVRLEAHEIIEVAQGKEISFSPLNPSYSLKRGVRYQSRTVKKSA